MGWRRRQAGEAVTSARMGDLVRFATASWSPKESYLVREYWPDDVLLENPGLRESDAVLMLMSRRGTGYLVTAEQTWPGPSYEVWLYRFAGNNRLGERTRIVEFEVLPRAPDLSEFLPPELVEAWPHV